MLSSSMNSLGAVLRRGFAGSPKASIGTAESGFFSKWGWNEGTWSGKAVTANSALQNDTVWACVKLISEAVSTLPLGFYKRSNNGGRLHHPDHPLFELLHYQPNPWMSAVNYWQVVSASLLLWGNSYSEITRNGNGTRIVALTFLLPDRMRLRRGASGDLEYWYLEGRVERRIPRRDMMHIKAFGVDGEVGLSAIQYGRNSIGGALAADQAADETFRDAGRATGIVTMDSVLRADQRDQVREHVKTVSKNGGVYVLEKGTGYQTLKFSPADAELLASRSFSVETICRWFRVPPVMIGHGDKASSWPTSTEAQGALFLRYVLRACILGIEQEIRRALLTPAERVLYFAEFGIEGLLRGDSAARSAFYGTALQNGWMTRNEVRALENLPPVEGGDVLTCQSNMLPLDKLGTMPAGNPPPPSPDDPKEKT